MINEGLDKQLLVQVIHLTEPLGKVPKRRLINPLHHTALNNHIHQLILIPLGYIHLQQLMRTLFEVHRRLYNQVYRPTQIDQILFSEIVNVLLLLLLLERLLLLEQLLLVVVHPLEVDDVLLTEDL